MVSDMKIPLKVLIIDSDKSSSKILAQTLEDIKDYVLSVKCANSLQVAEEIVDATDVNTIYIDPLTIGLEQASEFIFDIRKRIPSIVFVLYVDFQRVEMIRKDFYKGDRNRFNHYFKLDKKIPIKSFNDEVMATINQTQGDLQFNLTTDKINRLQEELLSLQKNTSKETATIPLEVLKRILEQLEELKIHQEEKRIDVKSKTVFLSYRTIESEYVEGLRTLLKKEGFTVVTGYNTNTYISKAILERITSCQFFLCLMTRSAEKVDGTYTTSPWLLEEKGVAIALGKKIVLMVEEGVKDIGGLQGDWQRIHFTSKGFLNAAFQAVEQLQSYVG